MMVNREAFLRQREAGEKGCAPFPCIPNPRRSFLRFAPDSSRLTIPNTYSTIPIPASLRSDGCSTSLRNAVRLPFGINVHLHRNTHSRFGTVAGDHLLLVLSQLLRSTLRGSDIVCRYGNDDFLLMLPDTAETQAQRAMSRVMRAVEKWNETTTFPYKVEIQSGWAAYCRGMAPEQVVASARTSAGVIRPATTETQLQVFSIQ